MAASGENLVEREGLSVRHPARFVLVGSGNPEEGELRPQLLDRFGLSVEVKTPEDLPTRIDVVRRRDEFERDPQTFLARWKRKDATLRRRIQDARMRLPTVEVSTPVLEQAARLCMSLGTDGLRGELTLVRAARALASFDAELQVTDEHLRRIAAPALRHRLRRNPLDESGSTQRVDRAVARSLRRRPCRSLSPSPHASPPAWDLASAAMAVLRRGSRGARRRRAALAGRSCP